MLFFPYQCPVAFCPAAVAVCIAVAATHRAFYVQYSTACTVRNMPNIPYIGIPYPVDHGGRNADEKKLELDHAYSYPLIRCQLLHTELSVVKRYVNTSIFLFEVGVNQGLNFVRLSIS